MRLLEKIRSGSLSRAELVKIRENALSLYRRGDTQAALVVDEINRTAPPAMQRECVFMGFCPGADFGNRQDLDWYQQGVCKFDFVESDHQFQRFCLIQPGDIIILKKREKFGETMRLFGHGTVDRVVMPDDGELQYLQMSWLRQSPEIETPLLGCNSTVDVRSIASVEAAMPTEFWEWLEPEAPQP